MNQFAVELGGYGFEVARPAAGAKSADTLSFRDVLAGDGEQVPAALQASGEPVNVEGLISFDRYIDPEFIDQEVEHIWRKHWQVACREEDIPRVGDRVAYDIVDLSFVVVRSDHDEIKAYYNSCPHRGRRLCDQADNAQDLRCPFHGWTWSLDGRLQWVPAQEDFPSVSTRHHSLKEVMVGRWGGNVFINPDPDALPLGAALGPLPAMFADHPLEERHTILHLRKQVRCNWKLTQEAFMEGYHVMETHWDGMPFFGSASSQYDVWDDGVAHVSRLVTPSVVADTWIKDTVSPGESARQFCMTMGLPLPTEPIHTTSQARTWCATQRRQQLEAESGHELCGRSNSYFLDMAKFFVFPNHHPWWGEALTWWYRFLPVGRDPDLSLMEVRITARNPKDRTAPPPHAIIDLGPDDPTNECEALGVIGHILHQDMSNLAEVQKGLKAAPRDRSFMTLGRYQESNIQHFHNVYRKLLSID